MIVPFKAVIEFLQEQNPNLTLSLDTLGNKGQGEHKVIGLLGIARTGVQYHLEGYRKGKASVPKRQSIKDNIFVGFCDLYTVNSENYKEKSLYFMNYLLRKKYINTDFIDVQEYITRIKNEEVPKENSHFYGFLNESVLLKFLCDYLSLWKNKDYREASPPQARMIDGATPEVVIANHFGDNYENYLTQQLISEENNEVLLTLDKLTNNSFDFSFFFYNKLTLVSGPGGQGKTSFLCALKILHSNSPKTFDNVFLVPLVNLTELSLDSITIGSDFVANYIKQNDGADINDINHNYLILLDGFNEFRSSKNKHIVDILTESLVRLINDVSQKNKPNISLILTTRETKTTLNLLPNAGVDFTKTILKGTPDDLYESIKEKYESVNYDFIGSEIEELARTPLYALMFKEFDDSKTISKIHNKYSLFDEVYLKRANQRLGSELHKSAYNKEYYLYFYYVVLPAFAYTLNTSKEYNNDYFFYIDDIENLLKTVTKDSLDKMLYRHQLHLFTNINNDAPETTVLSLERFLKHEESRIIEKNPIENDYAFRFEHQEWRDYLVAKHITDNVNILKSLYKHKNIKQIKALHLDCNVDSNIGKMVLQSFDMASSPERNKTIAKKFFGLEERLRISNCLYGVIKFLHVAFDFNEYLQLDLPKGKNKDIISLHSIFRPLTDFLQNNKGNKRLIKDINSDYDMLRCVTEILSKEAEYFRRDEDVFEKNHYQEAYNTIELAKIFTANCDIMDNQEGKLYVCLYEESLKCSEKRFNKLVPKELSSLAPSEMFHKGTDLLKRVAEKGFHLSANAIGIILSNPAPVLIHNIPELKPDFSTAFRYYMDVVYGANYINRDISYTVRQALNLLMKGYIKISDSNGFDPEERYSDLSSLDTECCPLMFAEKLTEPSVRFAESLVRKADGQDAAGLNFLRGYVAYASNKLDEASVFWNSPLSSETTIMYKIARKYYLGETISDEEILPEFKNNAVRIQSAGEGKIDLTHPVYWYIEAKEFMLSLVDKGAIENYKTYFENIEEEYKITNVVKSVYDYLNKR